MGVGGAVSPAHPTALQPLQLSFPFPVSREHLAAAAGPLGPWYSFTRYALNHSDIPGKGKSPLLTRYIAGRFLAPNCTSFAEGVGEG